MGGTRTGLRMRPKRWCVGVALVALAAVPACRADEGTAGPGGTRAGGTVFDGARSAGTTGAVVDPTSGSATSGGEVSLLFLQGASSAVLDTVAGTLSLSGVDSSVTYFSDRPNREAGRMTTARLVEEWAALFGDDPPNAALQSRGAADRDLDPVVELLGTPTYDGAGNLTYRIRVLDLPDATPERITFQQVSLFIDGGTTAAVPVSSASPSASYTLTVKNDSDQYQEFVLYQDPSSSGVAGAQPLAWLTASAPPKGTATFTWTLETAIFWSPIGSLQTGVTIVTAQTLPADATQASANAVELVSQNGAPRFGATSAAPAGQLSIVTTGGVPAGVASVGIMMSGQPVFAVPAGPSATYAFTPQPSYWIAAANAQQGSVMDLGETFRNTQVPFAGTTAMAARFHDDDRWTVTAG